MIVYDLLREKSINQLIKKKKWFKRIQRTLLHLRMKGGVLAFLQNGIILRAFRVIGVVYIDSKDD